MSITLIIYLAGLVEEIHTIRMIAVSVSILILVVAAISGAIRNSNKYWYQKINEVKDDNDYFYLHLKAVKSLLFCASAFVLVTIFLPTKSTIYLMASTSVAEKMIQSKDFKNLYEKSFELINKKIDEEIKEKSK